jgi:predicted permease
LEPLTGRAFLPQEDQAGGAPVAMISEELWQRHFAADPQVSGKTVNLGGAQYTVIGVLPAHFQFPSPNTDVWLTIPAEWGSMPVPSRAISPFLTIFGRMRLGVTLNQASAEAAVIHKQYAIAHPAMLDAKLRSPIRITPLKEDLVASVRTMLWMLFAAVGFVLLIACANVASLLLARAAARSREFAIRSALGASRSRIVAQLMAESVFLSLAGGAVGILLAMVALRWLPSIEALNLPRMTEVHLDASVLAFAVILSVLTGLLFGLAPGLGASRTDLISGLRVSGGTANTASNGLASRGPLVAGQIALSIVLLIGAALVIQSVSRLRGIDPGFNASQLLTMRMTLPPARYDTPLKKAAFYEELIRRLKAAPGIRGVALSMTLPMTGAAGTPVQNAALPPLRLNERPIEVVIPAMPGYFGALQISIKRGRDFSERDRAGAQRVTIIDEALARQFWPTYPAGLDPIGQRLFVGGINAEPAEIIGIAGDVHQNLERSPWPGTVYMSLAQAPPGNAMLAVRTAGEPLSFTRTVREQMFSIDPDQPVSDVHTMNQLIEAEVGQKRLMVILLGTFAGVAVLLALTGIYGAISYSVTQRVPELGIRRALGAGTPQIILLVMKQAVLLSLVGIAIGTVGAFALTRVMKSLLYQVSATDPATFAGIAILFLLIALAASYVPARRAARIDPVEALRTL